jgi:hypothetical protein
MTTVDLSHEDYVIPHTTTCSRCATYHIPVRSYSCADTWWAVDACGLASVGKTARSAVEEWNRFDLARCESSNAGRQQDTKVEPKPWKDSKVEMPKSGNVVEYTYPSDLSKCYFVRYVQGYFTDVNSAHWRLVEESKPPYVPPVAPLPPCPKCGSQLSFAKSCAWTDGRGYMMCDPCDIYVGNFPSEAAAESAWRRIAPHWGTA